MKKKPSQCDIILKFMQTHKNGIIKTDGWRGVYGFTDEFDVEPFNPRVEVIIEGQIEQ